MSDPKIPTPAAGADGLGNDMSDRSGWTSESELGDTDTPVGHADATWASDTADTLGTPTEQTGGDSDLQETGTTFGSDPGDDKPM